jgi:hypothetical protein
MSSKPDAEPPKSPTAAAAIQALANVFTTLVETFGWPGATVILTFWFVVWYATDDQKHRIIERYVLGTGVAQTWPIIILSLTFGVTALAQRRWYLKKLNTLTKEIEREGEEKSTLQGKKTQRQLQHAKTRTKPGGK